MRLSLSVLACAAAVALAAVALAAPGVAEGHASSTARIPVPPGFVGMNLSGPMVTPGDQVDLAHQFDLMVRAGVESVRVPFGWDSAQPYASWADVPAGERGGFQEGAGNVPTSFAATDQMVTLASERGLSLLPLVLYTPLWDAAPNMVGGLAAPRDDRPYGWYLTTLIDRYGPHGSFWSQHPKIPKRPIRMWQIWNEPDIVGYWPIQPFAASYVALVRAAHAAIKRADPGAKVVLAGMPNATWSELADIYAIHGSRKLFDVVDVHPYTKDPANVIAILKLVRREMVRVGDTAKPIIVGETAWPSSLHQTPQIFDFETTASGEARRIREELPLLAADRTRLGLAGFYYFTWMGDEYPGAYPFNFAGLLRFQNGQVSPKPALAGFRRAALALERCREKGRVATVCVRR